MALTKSLNAVPKLGLGHRRIKDLTPSQRLLLQIMAEHRFGWLVNVLVQDGQPVLDQLKVVRVARLGSEKPGDTVPTTSEFELKQPVRNLFDEFARIWNGTITRLEFRHGLPFLMEVTAADDTATLGPVDQGRQ